MKYLLDPLFIIQSLGLIGVFGIIFAESGLFFGFFLPGDSLLFTGGLLASRGYFNIAVLLIGCALCAIIGDSVGYAFGRKVGPALFSKEDSRFFHKKHIERARFFYERHGKKTIILARFVPIVRTFAPIIAGVGEMKYSTFLSFNVIGGVAWTLGLSLLGYWLGNTIPNVDRYLLPIIIVIIATSCIPVAVEYFKKRKSNL